MIPIASVPATSTVALTNWVSDFHATRPEESARRRPARGNSRTSQAQIRWPSARKKYVANSTMKMPATTCPTAVPTSPTRPTASSLKDEIVSCALSSASLSWASVTCSGPSRSQSRIWSMPLVTWSDRLPTPCDTWLPTKVKSSARPAIPRMTTRSDASLRGMPMRCIHATTGLTRAAISNATTSGSTTTRKKLSNHRMIRPAAPMTRNRQDQAAARSMP